MKYIVMPMLDGTEVMFVFPRLVFHNEMASMVRGIKVETGHGTDWNRPWFNTKPVSAGFVNNGVCSGKSDSLNIKSRPQDTQLLLDQFP